MASLVPIHAPQIQHIPSAKPQRPQQRGVRRGWRRVEAHADDGRRLERRGRARLHERGFLRCQEEVPGGQPEEVLQHVEVERAILFGRGHQHGAIATSGTPKKLGL